ncbi:hypothetical protein ACFWXH_19305 [Mesorhizobium sp. NPDC059054]|uniref:hypothetical protein n=1 Tax=Mesorhizobium sp. NPDC059054 TaxID=3346711 RepID=UPI0036C3171A
MAHYFTYRSIKLSAISMLMALMPLQAEAQVSCGDRDVIVARLDQLFQEHRIGYGLVGQAAVVEIYVSAAGTWTVLMTDVGGQTCIMGAGDSWENTLMAHAKERDS